MDLENKFNILRKDISSWNRTLTKQKVNFFYPETIKQLIEFKNYLKIYKKSYVIKTGNCSYDSKSLPVDNDAYVISLKKFNKISKIDVSKHTVVAQSGVKISDLVKFLKEKKYKIFCVPGGEKISLGGAVSANTIGKDSNIKFASFGDNILNLKVLDHNNKILNLSNTSKKFRDIIGGFGLNGLILEAKIKINKIRSENVKLRNIIVSDLSVLKKKLITKDEYIYAQIDPFFRKNNFGIIFTANTFKNNDKLYKNKNLNSNLIEKLIFRLSSLFINNFFWRVFYKCFFLLNKDKSYTSDLHNFHYSSKYKHMVPLIHSSGINDYEILIKKNFLKIMANIINYMSKNKIFCIYIIVKKIYRSKKKYFYSFNDNGFSVALSFQNNKNSRKFYEYLKKIIKKYDIKINLAKTDNVLVKKKVFKDKMFMSLYKNKILKNGKISRKRT